MSNISRIILIGITLLTIITVLRWPQAQVVDQTAIQLSSSTPQYVSSVVQKVEKSFTDSTFQELHPLFPGCADEPTYIECKQCSDRQLLNFVHSNLTWPRILNESALSGIIVATFVVNKLGEVKEPHIAWGLHPAMDAELLRVVNLMVEDSIQWTPGTFNGYPVNMQMNLPIRIHLE